MLSFGCVMSYNMLDAQLLLHNQSEGHKNTSLHYAHAKLSWFPGLSAYVRWYLFVTGSLTHPHKGFRLI